MDGVLGRWQIEPGPPTHVDLRKWPVVREGRQKEILVQYIDDHDYNVDVHDTDDYDNDCDASDASDDDDDESLHYAAIHWNWEVKNLLK